MSVARAAFSPHTNSETVPAYARRSRIPTSVKSSTAGSLPPTWFDLIPFLKATTILWIIVLAFSFVRFQLYCYFRSAAFRKMVKRAKESGRTSNPVIRFAKLFRTVTLRLERHRLSESDVSLYFGYPRCVAALAICICYMVNTYTQTVPWIILLFYRLYGLIISTNLAVQIMYSNRPIIFALSLGTLVDCLSIPSLLFSSSNQWLNFNFLQAYAVLVEWSLLEKHDIVLQNLSTLMRLCYNMFFQIACFLYITSCGVQFFELLGELPIQALRSETYQVTWANSVYFAVVTLMTVGYGDFVPYTFLGRMWVVFHIIFAAVLVSRGISLLIDALQTMRRGAGSYIATPGTKHVVVTGRVKWEFLRQFVIEFLEEPSNLGTRVIILASNPDWDEDAWNRFVDQKPLFNHHLVYLEGSALKVDDLHRAQVHTARGIFVLADPHRHDPYKEDSDILKSVLTVRNYSGTVPVYTLNILDDSSFQFAIALEHVVPSASIAQLNAAMQFKIQKSSTFFGLPYNPQGMASNGTTQLTLDPQVEENPSAIRVPRGHVSMPTGESAGNRSSFPSQSADWLGPGESREGVDAAHHGPAHSTPKSQSRSSISLCMEELETVLLSENIFCNGLSTLIANATLRVAPQSHSKDRPWLMEYKLGAECSVQQFEIRPEMSAMKVGDVATVLQDYGLVLLAVRNPTAVDWQIATPDVALQEGMIAMSLTYHELPVIETIADHAVALIVERNQKNHDRKIPGGIAASRSVDDALFDATFSGRPYLHPVNRGRLSILNDDEGDEYRLLSEGPSDVNSDSHQGEGPSSMRGGGSRAVPSEASAVASVNDQEISSGTALNARGSTSTPSMSTTGIVESGGGSKGNSDVEFEREGEEDEDDDAIRMVTSLAGTNRESIGRVKDETSTPGAVRSRFAADTGTSYRSSGKHFASHPSDKRLLRRRSRSSLRIHSTVERLPAALRGHVIICVDGETSLMNLDTLLHRIWHRRPGIRSAPPVVVIHPRFPKNVARRLGNEKHELFLLQGNSLSLNTLKQAQYQTARAFLILASATKDESEQGSTDSKAIFTVMALDSILAGRNTFVCCVLDAEGSLQLLRAPKEPRRVGLLLKDGQDMDALNAQLLMRTASNASLMRGFSMGRMGGRSGGGVGALSGTVSDRAGFGQSRSRSRASGLRSMGVTRSSGIQADSSQQAEGSEDDEVDEYDNLTGMGGTRIRDSERSEKRAREERYERQRYASGEMMISSLFTSLLAREYTDPGYIRLIRQLIGATSGSKGSWIRQLHISESWMSVEKAIGGRTYRELSTKLLEYGCITLGLYRSGDAPVRAETKSEMWIRGVDEVVYLERDGGVMDDYDDEGQWTPAGSMSSLLAVSREDNNDRWYGALGNNPIDSMISGGLTSNRLSFGDALQGLADDTDEFDRMAYICPSTKRRIHYQETENGENVLPYVYSCPEPYTAVSATDLVFVLCNPRATIPADWDDD